MGEQIVWLVENGDYWKAVWNDRNGGRKSRSLGHKDKVSKRQAVVKCREIEAELRNLARLAGDAPKLSDWLSFYQSSRTDVAESTRATYRECAVYLRAHFADDPTIDQITRAGASEWMAAMASGKLTHAMNQKALADPAFANPARRAWRPPKAATVARHVRAAKLMFQAAADQDRILFNPFDRLKGAPPRVVKDWREVSIDDLQRIREACPNAGWRNLFTLCRLAGLRLREALELEWSAIDWSGNRMQINEGVEVETTKRRFRVTPIDPARCPNGLAKLLRESFESAPDGVRLVCDGVLTNNLRRTALGILKRSGVGTYAKPFHTLRKCRISEMAMTYPQHVVQEWCGHDEEVSRRHYQRVPNELYAVLDTDLDTGSKENARELVREANGNPRDNP